MKLKEYIDGLFHLITGKAEEDEDKVSKSEKVFVILAVLAIFALGYLLSN